MIKNVVIWLVKLLKLEEVFIAEFKAFLKAKLEAKLANLEGVIRSIESSGGMVTEIEDKMGSIIHHLAGKPFDSFKNEFHLVEDGVKQVVKELKEEIEKL